MDHIKNILNQVIKSSCPKSGWKNSIMQNWQEIMGPLANKIFIERIQKNSIVLGVTDSCWMQELHMLSDILKKKINQTLEKPYIENIQFKYSGPKKAPIQKIKKNLPFTQTTYTLNSIEKNALDSIKDPELSKALSGFLKKCQQS